MAVRHGYGKIVTDGLVLHLDAADRNSYPGSGTTWYDLSENQNNGTLTNGPVFDSGNKGSIVLDGNNDYISTNINNLNSSVVTINMWANIKNLRNKIPIGWNTYGIYSYLDSFGYNTFIGDRYGLTPDQVTNLQLLNNIICYTFVMYGEGTYANNKIYINGQDQILNNGVLSNGNSSNVNFGDGTFFVGRSPAVSTNYITPINLYTLQIYNRALTPQEILQNYNASKTRFRSQ